MVSKQGSDFDELHWKEKCMRETKFTLTPLVLNKRNVSGLLGMGELTGHEQTITRVGNATHSTVNLDANDWQREKAK